MPHVNYRSPLAACALAALLALSGCGGGSASAPGTVSGSSGFVVDGYVRGATVLCDDNNNGSADAGEASVLTDSSGFFRFSPACGAPMVASGGTNLDTGLPFVGMMKAPAGATVVTPLTTLVSAGMTVDQVNTALGLPAGTDLLNTDPARKLAGALVNGALLKKTLAVQQILQKTTETLAGLTGSGGDAARSAIYNEVAAAAATLPFASPLGSDTALDAAVVASLVRAAVLRIAASTTLPADVRAAAQSVNPDSLAQVIAGAIKAQADSILAASDAGLTAATLTAQSDYQITTFVVTNRSQLGAAPSADTLALGNTLTDQVVASQTDGDGDGDGGGGTPPTTSGTVLVSFDEADPAFTGMGAYGGALPTVEAGPANGSGNALRILKPAAPDTWGGVFFGVEPIAFAADRKTITARVNATRAGAVIKFKVESANGGPAVEVASSPTGTANTWETLSWTFSGVDVSKSYTVIAITPDSDRVTDGQSYYIDDITLAPASGGGGGSASPLTFSSGFSASSRTAEGGEFGGFSGSNQDGFGCNNPDRCGQGGTFTGDAASGFYYYYQTPTPATDLFAGIYVQPAGVTGGLSGSTDTAGVQITNQTMLKFKFGQNPEWFSSTTNNFMIVMDLGKLYMAGGNACHLQLRRVVTPTSAAVADYAIALNSFALVQDCAGAVSTAAQALAVSPISQVAFQAAGGGIALSDGVRTSGANLSVAVGGLYPTTLVVNGAITFE